MNNKLTYGLLGVFMVGLLAVASVSAFGMGNAFGLSSEDQEEREEFRAEVEATIESDDYETWKELHESQFTEENFVLAQERYQQMGEIRNLHEQMRDAIEVGDDSLVEELRTQLEEIMPEGFAGKGFGRGMHRAMMGGQGFDGNCHFADAE